VFILALFKFIMVAGCFGIVTGYLSGSAVSGSLAIFAALIIALVTA